MSYSSFVGARDWLNSPTDYPQTLMQYAIAGLQWMYGADHDTRRGNATYVWGEASGAWVVDGIAVLEGPSGLIEVSAGDPHVSPS
jgi:hypothetical protein